MSIILAISLLLTFSCSSVEHPVLGLHSSSHAGMTLPPSPQAIKSYKQGLEESSAHPDEDENDLKKMKPNQKQAFLYLQAEDFITRGSAIAACANYIELSSDPTFPLAQLALIKSLNKCPYTKDESLTIWNGPLAEVLPHNKELFLQNSIELSERVEQSEHHVDFSIQYVDYLKTKKEKEESLQALSIKYKEQLNLQTKIEEKLFSIAPRLIKRPSKESLLKVAKDYSRVRKFEKSRKYYQLIFDDRKKSKMDRLKSFYSYAFTFKLQREKKKYTWQLERLISWAIKNLRIHSGSQRERNKFWEYNITLARAQWTVNYRSKAEKTLAKVLRDAPHRYRAKSYFILGKIEAEKNNFRKSESYYKRGLEQKSISDSILQELSWSLGFNYYLSGKYSKALEVFSKAHSRTKDQTFKHKLAFWQAQSHLQLKQQDKAEVILNNVSERDPFGYYGIISSMELNKALPPIPKVEFDQVSPSSSFEWALALKDYELAKAILEDMQNSASSVSEITALLPQYARAKWYSGGISKFFKIPHDDRNEVLKNFLNVAYPTPYDGPTVQIETRQGVPSELIYSIARQESAFNPRSRSWADAFGLLQLTPERASSLSQELKIPYEDYNDLYTEGTNLRLGAALLKKLSNVMKGSFIAITASYNAGEDPVRGWLERKKLTKPFEFIEAIPYKETQTYVKLVLRNYSIYKRLDGKPWKESSQFLKSPLF